MRSPSLSIKAHLFILGKVVVALDPTCEGQSSPEKAKRVELGPKRIQMGTQIDTRMDTQMGTQMDAQIETLMMTQMQVKSVSSNATRQMHWHVMPTSRPMAEDSRF